MYALQVKESIVQRSTSITDLQRIASSLGYSHYVITLNYSIVYQVKGV